MTKLILLITVILFIQSSICGQTYDYLIDSLFKAPDGVVTPGYSISIIQNNEINFQKSHGYANVKEKVKVDSDTKFAIASCSKQFTAYCILLLEQDDKLELTDNIRKYIPELPEYSSPVQIRHLLSHTSGIRDHIVMLGWSNNQKEKYYSFDGTLKSLEKLNGLSFKPGERFAYSNTGYVLLALLVERVSGTSFEEFAKQNIFVPLRMSNTEFSFRRKFEEYGSVNPYNYDPEKKKYKEFKHLEVNAMGATGIYTTISDYILWDKHLSNPSKNRENIIKNMFVSDTLNSGQTVNYNFGFKHRTYKEHKIIEHAGGWANYNFQYTRIPEKKLSIIISSNNENHYPIGMANEILEVIIPERPDLNKTESAALPEMFLTNFFCPDFTSASIIRNQDKYSLYGKDLYPSDEFPLLQTKKGTLIDSAQNRFDTNKKDTSFCWYGGSYFHTPRKFTPNLAIEGNKTQNYTGVFYSEELGKLKIKYRRNSGTFKIKTSFGKNPKALFIDNRLIKTNEEYSLFLASENQVLLGNSRVLVRFNRIK